MLRKLQGLALAFLLALAPGLAVASVTTTGAGIVPAAGGGGGGYVGPGDIVSGAKYFFSTRAYDAAHATTSTKALKITRASDSMACDVVLNTSGDLGNVVTTGGCTASGAAASFCSSTTCSITLFYDQISGTLTCGPHGSPAATLVFTGGANNRASVAYAGSGTGSTECSTATATSQPLTVSVVFIRTGQTTTQNDLVKEFSHGTFLNNAAQLGSQFGTPQYVSAADNTWHTAQIVANSTASLFNIDGSATTGLNFNTGTLGADFYMGGPTVLLGQIPEAGVWPVAFTTTQAANVCHNQATYFGITATC